MQRNDITKLLGIQGVRVTNLETPEECGAYIFHIESTQKAIKCPCCNELTSKIHDKRIQKVRDIPIKNYPTYLSVLKRRFRCGCGRRFTEHINFIPKHHQISSRVSMKILEDLREMNPFKSVALKNNVSVATVKRIQDKIYHTAKPCLPNVLSIDEFKGNSDNIKYHCSLVDVENKKLLDILKDRKQNFLEDYFSKYSRKERATVKFFVCDMWKPYTGVAQKLFPDAKIIIDKYHYVRLVIWAIDGARKRIQKSMETKHKKMFFNCKRLLMKRESELTVEGLSKLETLFWYSQELLQAYTLKELFFKIMDMESPQEKEIALEKWIVLAKTSGVAEFERYSRTFETWKEEIVNSFYFPYTNGCTEGINNLIKVIKRISFGYRNFNSFRTRILHIKS